MQTKARIIPANTELRDAIISLLDSEKLPVEDLSPTLDNFLAAVNDNLVIGAIGLELYGNHGLLRSLVVSPPYRKTKIASALIDALEKRAVESGLKNIYLLTESAEAYFNKKGYQSIDRNTAPETIKQSSEFSHVCPVSAILMKKEL